MQEETRARLATAVRPFPSLPPPRARSLRAQLGLDVIGSDMIVVNF
jgi:hypothetical protein